MKAGKWTDNRPQTTIFRNQDYNYSGTNGWHYKYYSNGCNFTNVQDKHVVYLLNVFIKMSFWK